MKFVVLAIASTILVGCGENRSKTWTHDEIMDIAGDTAPDTSTLESKFADLESQITDLETKNNNLESEIAAVKAESENTASDLQRLRSDLGQ